MSDDVRHFEIDDRLQAYEGYIPDGWMKETFGAVLPDSVLGGMTWDLMMSWRTTAYTASMPGVFAKAIQHSTLGYGEAIASEADVLTLAESVLKRVSRKVPELVEDSGLRARLMAEMVKTADEVRVAAAAAKPHLFPAETVWRDFLKQHVFQMSVWSSQRVAYVAFYNAYEAFLVDCLRVAAGLDQLRASDKSTFNPLLRTALGDDISLPCWSHHEINNARLVRHALSHAGGRETADLKKQKHGVRLVGGALQIFPEDNKKMLDRLRKAVEVLAAAAAGRPEFTRVAVVPAPGSGEAPD